jgi:hypothetical protein
MRAKYLLVLFVLVIFIGAVSAQQETCDAYINKIPVNSCGLVNSCNAGYQKHVLESKICQQGTQVEQSTGRTTDIIRESEIKILCVSNQCSGLDDSVVQELLNEYRFNVSLNEIQELYSLPIATSANTPEFGFLVRFTRSRNGLCTNSGNTRGRTETANSITNSDVHPGLGFSTVGSGCERTISIRSSFANGQGTGLINPLGAVANWNSAIGVATDGTNAFHQTGNRNHPPFKGMAALRPPVCPLIVSNMPSYSQGGSDYCVCNGRVIRTNQDVICIHEDDIRLGNYCENLSSGCGNNLISGLWNYDFTSSGNNPGIAGSFEDDIYRFYKVSERGLIDSRNLPSSSGYLNSHPEVSSGFAAQQTYSTWLYVHTETVPFRFFFTTGDQSSPDAYIHVSLQKLNQNSVGDWSFSQIVENRPDHNNQQYWTLIKREYIPSQSTITLSKGWYFLKVHRTYLDRNHIFSHMNSASSVPELQIVDANFQRVNPYGIFKAINVNGPLSFNLNQFEIGSSQAEYACESDPYYPGHWSNSSNWDGSVSNDLRCCRKSPINTLGSEDPDGRACTLNEEGVGNWGQQKECADSTGSIVSGTHNLRGVGCCGYAEIVNDGSVSKIHGYNLGTISESGEYVCLQNRAPNADIGSSEAETLYYGSNAQYVWRKADTHYYQIMANNTTQIQTIT